MSARRLLVIGATGQVGRRVAVLARASGRWEVFGTCHSRRVPGLLPLALERPETVAPAFREARPHAAVIAGGLAAVDYCESHPDEARRANVDGPAAVAEASRAAGCRPVLLSTEYVFDGRGERPYREDDAASPLNAYGRTKLEAEGAMLASGAGALVLRSSVIYSFDPGGRNFLMQALERIGGGGRMSAASDQVSNPTYAPGLARAILEALERGLEGLYHAVGPDSLARDAFGRRVCDAFGLDASRLDGKPTAALGQPAPRPLQGALDPGKLAREGIEIEGVDAGLAAARAERDAAAGGRA